ncbi:hypothetical protein AURDEDRAFT_186783 [Auricularia subglabra TFB-10046 SS5]|uniref:F-box domain-containing protein n=1 Tax=Auricularia subglabra (strain TFB-10046 / SS5) TaxID=717982 RepID=J0D2L2_AURST|nr:hypothetical protein AURDEDRAFT_186783 [Auricularia subglabra TFB-10046 SS5]
MTMEADWLRDWIAQAVQCMFSVWRDADEETFSADTSASIAYAIGTVSVILKEAARDALPVHTLCKLPRPVLCNIWSHLSLHDALALSRTSTALYNVVFYSPELWTDLAAPDGEPKLLHPDDLQVYVKHSVAEPLHVSLLNTGEMFVPQAPVLAQAMPRIRSLRLDCCDLPEYCAPAESLRGSFTWASLLRVLAEPAPHLVSLQLRHVEGELVDMCYPTDVCIPINYSLFSGIAPSLRRCRLGSILLPPVAQCGAFENVTAFSYTISLGIFHVTIALIMEAMPRLEVLELASFTFPTVPGGHERVYEAVPHSALRILIFSFYVMHLRDLACIFPLEQLQELWLTVHTTHIYKGLRELYSGTVGMRLGLQYPAGIVTCLYIDGSALGPKVVVNNPGGLADILSSFTALVWLSVHEHLFNNIIAGAPPPLPALEVLCVCLAAPSAHVDGWPDGRHPARDSSGFLINDSDEPPWEFPALREVRIGVLSGAYGDGPCSIALYDVARWIRHALTFGSAPGAKLDAVVLSGVWVADMDFCAAWKALMEGTESILLEEESDPRYFPTDDMLPQTRSASLFPT